MGEEGSMWTGDAVAVISPSLRLAESTPGGSLQHEHGTQGDAPRPMKFILASDLRCLNKESSLACYE
jgi:hypothetical protein